jgi:hypothetical protein
MLRLAPACSLVWASLHKPGSSEGLSVFDRAAVRRHRCKSAFDKGSFAGLWLLSVKTNTLQISGIRLDCLPAEF